MDDKINKLFISVLGYWQVGKSCMISNLLGFPFDNYIVATRGLDYTNISVNLNNKEIKLKICDTVGGPKYRNISSSTIPISDGFLLVFSLDLRPSFEEIKYWLNIIKDYFDMNEKAIIIVGNKNDIDKREISYEEASKFAELNNFKYFETSAINGNNIQNVFNVLYNDTYNKKIESNLLFKNRIKDQDFNKNHLLNLYKYYLN